MKKIALLALIGLAGSASAAVWSGAGFIIPDNVPAGTTSVIAVSGDTSSITAVEITLTDLRHTWVGDLVATVTSPGGTTFTLFSRIGATTVGGVGDSSNLGGNYSFSDSAAGDIWAEAAAGATGYVMLSGAYRTTDALSSTATSMNAAFAGEDSNGNWTLTIADNAGADLGDLGSWELNIVPTPGSLAVLGFAGLAAGRRRRN